EYKLAVHRAADNRIVHDHEEGEDEEYQHAQKARGHKAHAVQEVHTLYPPVLPQPLRADGQLLPLFSERRYLHPLTSPWEIHAFVSSARLRRWTRGTGSSRRRPAQSAVRRNRPRPTR